MDNQTGSHSKHVFIIFIILIVSLLVAGFFLFRWYRNYKAKPATSQTAGFKVDTTDLSKVAQLKGFPKNFPLEAGQKVLQNSESKSNDGRLQSTKKFTSSLSAQRALTAYADFFKKNGWTSNTTGTIESPAIFSKNQDILMIVTSKDVITSKTVVEITIVQKI